MVIRYIRGTLHLFLILMDYSLSVNKLWVDASFSARPDCKGHTRVIMYMVSDPIIELPRKQKINGRISMEADIVGSDNAFPQCLWYR